MRDEAIRGPAYRVIFAHALTVAHMEGHLISDDHPAWDAIYTAISAAREADPGALDTIEREIARLHDRPVKPSS
ncbi:hypothetical protein [Paracoccus saliphilus]|nr:hypothetical protein [Paracoccus saliphilus]WCR05618.1 hypothetical protein JHX88_21290 [Paracoccus saliphilus]